MARMGQQKGNVTAAEGGDERVSALWHTEALTELSANGLDRKARG